jgi:oligogalacturonide lyase
MTRRALLLASLAAPALAQRGRVLPFEGKRYADPATEFPVEMLTDPNYPSFLPYPYARAIARRGLFFLFASDRGSGMQAFRFELRSGEMKQLTEAQDLQSWSLNILPDDRTFCYLAGRSLWLTPFGSLKDREVYRAPEGWEFGDGLSVSVDGVSAVLVEKQGQRHRLRLIGIARGTAVTVAEADEPIRHPQPRPRRASVLYQHGESLHLVNFDGQQNKRLCDLKPSPGAAQWSPDGRSVFYLSAKEKLITLREVTPDTMQDKLIAPTSQFRSFSRNSDASVFIGAGGSVASPYILILVRAVRRELTLCEHKASDPSTVAPIFSPTSQRIYFESDRHGKSAIYSVVLDKFLEKTDEDDKQEQKEKSADR